MPTLSAKQYELLTRTTLPIVGRAAAGAKAHKAGSSFEAALAVQHVVYHNADIATFDEFPMPTRPVGPEKPLAGSIVKPRKGAPHRIVTGSAPYDFAGALGTETRFPGRHVAIEAKHTSKQERSLAVLPKGKKGSGLRFEQLNRLVTLSKRFGAVSILVWDNAGVLGVMGPAALWRLQAAQEQGLTRARTERFLWLDRGSLDYLPPVLETL